MNIVNVHEAKTTLSALLVAVAAGEEIIIAESGKPVARLVPVENVAKRILGLHDGAVEIPDDFDTYLPPAFEPYVG